MRKIAVVGAESSGKTTLARDLALALGGAYVPEFARTFLEARGPAYEQRDLLTIARGQAEAEDHASRTATGPVICDTDLITIRIWSEEKYGRCDPWILRQSEERPYDHWLLCAPDIPWEPDPLRENPHDRDRLFAIYERLLRDLSKPFTVVRGTPDERRDRAIAVITGAATGAHRGS